MSEYVAMLTTIKFSQFYIQGTVFCGILFRHDHDHGIAWKTLQDMNNSYAHQTETQAQHAIVIIVRILSKYFISMITYLNVQSPLDSHASSEESSSAESSSLSFKVSYGAK